MRPTLRFIALALTTTTLTVLGSAATANAAGIARSTQIVKIMAPTVATANPGGGRTVMRLATTSVHGGPNQLRVMGRMLGEGSRVYYKVALPIRPNGTTGWVASDRVQVLRTPYFVVIDISKRDLTVYRAGRRVKHTLVVVGAPRTPTPTGEHFMAERLKQTYAGGFDGSWVLPIAFSNVWMSFDGGPGRVAMHGRGGAAFATPLGTAGSNGCIRMPNAFIAYLAATLPEGTPVRVQR